MSESTPDLNPKSPRMIQLGNSPPDVSNDLLKLVLDAFDVAFDIVQKQVVIIPFIYSIQNGQVKIRNIVVTKNGQAFNLNRNLMEILDFEKCVTMARSVIPKLPSDVNIYAILYVGTVMLNTGDKATAIIAETGERGRDYSLVFGQHVRRGDDREVLKEGIPNLISTRPSLFA